MKTPVPAYRLAELPLLSLLLLLPLLAGRVLGGFMTAPSTTVSLQVTLVFLLACGLFQGAFFWWMARRAPAGTPWAAVLECTSRIELQVAMQVLTRAAIVGCLVWAIDELIAPPDAAATVASANTQAVMWKVLSFLGHVLVVYIISISWWRCLSLRRSGADFAALINGSFNDSRVVLAASVDSVGAALDRHLDRLQSRQTPRFSRMFYQANVNVVSYRDGGRRSCVISWALLPVRVHVTVESTGASSAALAIHCALRGGLHQLELFPNPAVVLAVMRYLHTNLFEPLASELALTGAVRKQDELRHRAVESQLRILQAQIEPHFLFNTLANVRHLYRTSVEEGESMMDHLIVYLRSTLEELRSDVSTVSKEMDLVLHYLAIMKIRMGERLSYSFISAGDAASAAFPPAMLISLVENAIMHGLADRPDGKLTISAAREAAHVRVSVLDNGAGFSSVQGSGVGLSNIQQRLEVLYGSRAWLEVGALPDGGFMASIVVPFSESES